MIKRVIKRFIAALFLAVVISCFLSCKDKEAYGTDNGKWQKSVRVLTVDGDTATIYIRVGIKVMKLND